MEKPKCPCPVVYQHELRRGDVIRFAPDCGLPEQDWVVISPDCDWLHKQHVISLLSFHYNHAGYWDPKIDDIALKRRP